MQSRLWPALRASALGALCLAPTVASADVVTRPPRDCPYGSFGVAGRHTSGTYCRYESCETDEDCGRRGLVCRPSALCTEVRTVRFFADRRRTQTRRDIQQVGHAECAEEPCAVGTCTRARFCVPAGEARREEPPEPEVPPEPAPADDPPETEDDSPEAESEEGPATAADPASNGPDAPADASGGGLCSASPAPGPRVAALLGLAVALVAGRRRAR